MIPTAEIAKKIVCNLKTHFTLSESHNAQVLCLAEEAGEFVGAYRRWSGQARRTGTFYEVTSELADVVIAAYVTAEILGINLDEAVIKKNDVILTRGWKHRR